MSTDYVAVDSEGHRAEILCVGDGTWRYRTSNRGGSGIMQDWSPTLRVAKVAAGRELFRMRGFKKERISFTRVAPARASAANEQEQP